MGRCEFLFNVRPSYKGKNSVNRINNSMFQVWNIVCLCWYCCKNGNQWEKKWEIKYDCLLKIKNTPFRVFFEDTVVEILNIFT